jgi:hypothetical protein
MVGSDWSQSLALGYKNKVLYDKMVLLSDLLQFSNGYRLGYVMVKPFENRGQKG